MSVFSQRLKEAMTKRGVNQAYLAKELKISKSALSQYLSGRFCPKDDKLIPIAEKLCVSPGWLRGYDDNSSIPVILSEEESNLIWEYRSNNEIKSQIDFLLYKNRSTYDIFRAAKSRDGASAPSLQAVTEARLKRLDTAPETNEDL